MSGSMIAGFFSMFFLLGLIAAWLAICAGTELRDQTKFFPLITFSWLIYPDLLTEAGLTFRKRFCRVVLCACVVAGAYAFFGWAGA